MIPRSTLSTGIFILLITMGAAISIAACSSSRSALAEQREMVRQLEQRVKALEGEVSSLKEQLEPIKAEARQTEDALYSHLFSDFEKDDEGQTPDAGVRRHLQAFVKKDWPTAYQCIGDPPIALSQYIQDMDRATEDLLEYRLSSYQLRSPDRARVFVAYTIRYQNTGKDVRFETEPWAVVKRDRIWKVRWLPRQ